MKNALFIISLFLACSAVFATKTALTDRLSRLATTPFAKTIIETIQVELETSADPRPKIIQLIQELLDETRAAQEQADRDIAASRDRCSSTISDLEDIIAQYENTIKTDSEEKTAKEGELNQKKSELATHESALKAFESELEGATTARNNAQTLFEEKDKKFNKILDILREVRTWIANRRGSRYAFLQKNEGIMASFAEIKSEEFATLSPGFSKLVTFLATKVEKALQAPTAADETAEAGLDRIIEVIDKLIGDFEDQRLFNINFNNKDIESYENTKTRLEGSIASETIIVAGLTSEVSGLTQRIATLTTDIETNTGLLDTKKSQLIIVEEGCKAEEAAYAKLSADRAEELNILEEVLRIVKEELSNRREYTENTIKNSDIEV